MDTRRPANEQRQNTNAIKILELSNETPNTMLLSDQIPIAEPYDDIYSTYEHPECSETNTLIHNQIDSPVATYIIKVIFIGDTNTGKTHSLYALQQANKAKLAASPVKVGTMPAQSTIGVEFAGIRRTIESICFKYNIWDTAGQEKYRSITHSFFKNAAIAVLFFDLTNYQSFISLSGWLQDIHNNCPPSVIIHLVGNKLDLIDKRQVHQQDIDTFVNKNNLRYSEISAHTGESIEKILYEPTCSLLDMIKRQKIPIKDIAGIKINEYVEVRTGKASSLCSKCTIV